MIVRLLAPAPPRYNLPALAEEAGRRWPGHQGVNEVFSEESDKPEYGVYLALYIDTRDKSISAPTEDDWREVVRQHNPDVLSRDQQREKDLLDSLRALEQMSQADLTAAVAAARTVDDLRAVCIEMHEMLQSIIKILKGGTR